MAQILVRKLDDKIFARVKSRAKANGRSTEAEVREIIAAAVLPEAEAKRTLASYIGSIKPGRSQADIDAYVRALRDEWNR